MDDEAKLTLHGLVQHYIMLNEDEKNRKLNDLLDALDFNQARRAWSIQVSILHNICLSMPIMQIQALVLDCLKVSLSCNHIQAVKYSCC